MSQTRRTYINNIEWALQDGNMHSLAHIHVVLAHFLAFHFCIWQVSTSPPQPQTTTVAYEQMEYINIQIRVMKINSALIHTNMKSSTLHQPHNAVRKGTEGTESRNGRRGKDESEKKKLVKMEICICTSVPAAVGGASSVSEKKGCGAMCKSTDLHSKIACVGLRRHRRQSVLISKDDLPNFFLLYFSLLVRRLELFIFFYFGSVYWVFI